MTTLTLNTSLLSSRRILAAFSGGLDSTVLLHQLVLWRERHPDVTLRAIHIHHGLSLMLIAGCGIAKPYANAGRFRW